MFCSKCGQPVGDDVRFCPHCGAGVGGSNGGTQGSQGLNHQHAQRKKPPVIAIVAIVALVVICGLGAWLLLGGQRNTSTSAHVTQGGTGGASDTPNGSASPLSIDVQQVDASEFPHVKLYLTIQDPSTGEVPENLDPSLFYIRKEDANATFVKQTVTTASQLNEQEALKVDLVADVSGSMTGTPLADAQSVMRGFIDSMQFDAGDEAELTSFSTGVRLEQEFTDNASTLKSKVDALVTSDQTSLYDALYTAVERVAAQSGARCVIAFTDGADNYSSCSIDDVAEVATRYRVPIFIIGMGSTDYSNVQTLAEQTGGKYYSVDSTISMSDIYDEIYRTEKQLYLLEFEDETGASAAEEANIEVGYDGTDFTGECSYSYTPHVLSSADGTSIFLDGPEATVEGYLKNWAPAVTNSDYSRIAPYIKHGSDLYDMQTDFVLLNVEEELDSYEITGCDYSDNEHCTVSTRETFYVQIQGKSLQLLTQVVTYSLEYEGGEWLMTDILSLENPVVINQ